LNLNSQIIITKEYDKTIQELRQLAKNGESFVEIIESPFKVEHANLAIEKAYLASSEKNIIILAGDFSPVVQNRLLKILEEPPKNKEFIMLIKSKSTILPTIKSRLPITIADLSTNEEILDLNLEKLDIKAVYEFIQKNSRTSAKDTVRLVENISKKAIFSQKYNLDEKSLNLFKNATLALDKGSPASFVLTALLLKLLARKKRR